MVWLADAQTPPGMRIYAIGDVHGCLGPLEAMHDAIEKDLELRPVDDWRLIHVGDYVDRGPESRSTLQYLVGLCATQPRAICLLGNHDEMFVHAMKGGGPRVQAWLTHGGVQTLESYGFTRDGYERRLLDGAGFDDAVPRAHLAFIQSLPRSVSFGDYFFVHAGIDPSRSLANQDPDEMIWIRDRFLNDERELEKVIIHGHTPVRSVDVQPNRVGIDTGLVFGRSLTCLVLEGAVKAQLLGRDVVPLPVPT
ncbi:MAG: metallophosphoesterase family protein [Pseudomonadota bacterium]